MKIRIWKRTKSKRRMKIRMVPQRPEVLLRGLGS
jgi:hypothetical protein